MATTMKEFRALVGQRVDDYSNKGFTTTVIATEVIDELDKESPG